VSKRNQRIQVGDLRPGMYVVKLDRPWISTPFDLRGFPILSKVQVDLLSKYCKTVYVDPERAGKRTVARFRKKLSLARRKTSARKPASSRARKKNAARAR
jgi:hypothetical protein